MYQVRLKSFQCLQVFRNSLRRQVRRGEHQPIAAGVVMTNATSRLRTGDVATDYRKFRVLEIARSRPHSLQERLLFGPADSFLQIEPDRQTGRAAGRDVQALLRWHISRCDLVSMFYEIVL